MKKVITVIGARPQFIKAAAVSRRFLESTQLAEVLVHTGQHYDANMSDVFFDELGIPKPAHNLGIAGGGHGEMTGRMLEALEGVLLAEKPDVVMVYGDTNSTLAAALAASKLHIKVAHVEAGLRSFNRTMPEEINRVLTDHCSDLLFTPTETGTSHLRAEGIASAKIHQVGDVMFDAALHFGVRAKELGIGPGKFGLREGTYVLATVHRQENTDHVDRLTAVLGGLQKVAETIPVLLPLHPRTKSRIEAAGLQHLTEGLTLVEPLGYLEMVAVERHAAVIATDSGGVQKEAFFYEVPCVTLRDETEWTELVSSGWNRIVPPVSADTVADAILGANGTTGDPIRPYGDGTASQQILSILETLDG